MRSSRLPYVALLVGAAAALVGSVAWAVARPGRERPPGHAAAACAPANLPGPIVQVRLMSMGGSMTGNHGGMMGQQGGMMRLVANRVTVPTGRVSFVAANVSGHRHELVVLPLAAGRAAGQRVVGANDRVDEAGSVGEASRSCGAGVGDGIKPGTSGWVTLDLKPGRYELVCNLAGHYRSGMYTELDVEMPSRRHQR